MRRRRAYCRCACVVGACSLLVATPRGSLLTLSREELLLRHEVAGPAGLGLWCGWGWVTGLEVGVVCGWECWTVGSCGTVEWTLDALLSSPRQREVWYLSSVSTDSSVRVEQKIKTEAKQRKLWNSWAETENRKNQYFNSVQLSSTLFGSILSFRWKSALPDLNRPCHANEWGSACTLPSVRQRWSHRRSFVVTTCGWRDMTAPLTGLV
jgi:hypothetical protein